MPFMYNPNSYSPNRASYNRRSNIEIVTPALHVPDAPSPRYHHLPRHSRVVDVDIVERSPDAYRRSYSPQSPRPHSRLMLSSPSSPASTVSSFSLDEDDTQGELANYYQRQLVHRPRPQHALEHHHQHLALVPVGNRNREIVHAHPSGAYVVEREPAPERKKSTKKLEPVVIEKKQTMMLRDEKGNWTKVRRVVRS